MSYQEKASSLSAENVTRSKARVARLYVFQEQSFFYLGGTDVW